jgi:hypothetical protein
MPAKKNAEISQPSNPPERRLDALPLIVFNNCADLIVFSQKVPYRPDHCQTPGADDLGRGL